VQDNALASFGRLSAHQQAWLKDQGGALFGGVLALVSATSGWRGCFTKPENLCHSPYYTNDIGKYGRKFTIGSTTATKVEPIAAFMLESPHG
jgi:hypothetical protein